jgi:PAS domain S-box-containing protein
MQHEHAKGNPPPAPSASLPPDPRSASYQAAALELTFDALWDWDIDSGRVLWNSAMTRLFGYPLSDFTQDIDFWKDHIHPDDRGRVVDSITAAVEEGWDHLWQAEYRFLRADGSYAWVLDRGRVEKDSTGRVVRMVGALRDESQQRQNVEKLSASEARYRALVEASSFGVWRMDPQGRFIEPSNEVCDMIGITPEEALTRDWRLSIHPDDIDRVEREWTHALQTGKPHACEQRLKLKDGTYRWNLIRAVAVRDSSGNIVEWVGSHQDIHQRKLDQEALERSEARYRALAEATSAAIWTARPDGSVAQPQERLARMTGLSLEGTLDWGWLDAIHPDDRERTLAASVAIREGNAQAIDPAWSYHVEHRVRQADGQYRWFSARAAAVRDAEGRLVEIVGATQDIHERKRVEEALRRSVVMQQLVMQSAHAAVCLTGPNGEMEEPSEGLELLTGLRFEQYKGFGWQQAYHPDDLDHINRIFADASARLEPCEWEHRWRMKDGSWRWFLERVVPMKDDAGRLTGWGSVHVDIDDLRRAQDELQRRERLLRSMAEAMPQAVWTTRGADEPLEYANRQWQAWTGMSPEEFNALPPGGWCHPEDLEQFRQTWAEGARGVGVFSVEFRHLRRIDSGHTEYRLARLDIMPVRSQRESNPPVSPGQPARPTSPADWFVGTLTDVAEQRRVERMLRERAEAAQLQRRWLEMVFDALPVPVLLADADSGELMIATREARRLVRQLCDSDDPRELVRIARVLLPDGSEVPPDQLPMNRVMRGERLAGAELSYVTPRGRLTVLVDGELLTAAHGHPRTAVVCYRDISGLKAIEAELRSASEAKDRFVAVLSHELRTPLTPVLTTAQMFETDISLSTEFRDAMSMVRRNVELEIRLIDDLLDLTRISRGKLRMDLRPVNLAGPGGVLDNVLTICHPDIRAKGLQVTLDLPPSPLTVLGDAARLHQVFWNLMKNAIKFTSEGGKVDLRATVYPPSPTLSQSASAGPGEVVIHLKDDGIGIPADLLPRVFDAFMQGDHDPRRFGGLGLGLAIAKALVELHGGTLEARSEGAARGAVFEVRLPLGKPPETPANPSVSPPGSHSTAGLRILLVEDHADTARVMQRLLRHLGHQPTAVSTVAGALAALRAAASAASSAGRFDLMISDIGLPDGSGYDLMRQSAGFRPPAIALSGFGMDEDLSRSREVGFAEHLTKPIDAALLERTLRQAVGQT